MKAAENGVVAYAGNESEIAWSPDSKTHVATMGEGDFQANERSVTVAEPTDVRIELAADDGTTTVLKASTPLLAGEIIDATVMSKAALVEFLTACFHNHIQLTLIGNDDLLGRKADIFKNQRTV